MRRNTRPSLPLLRVAGDDAIFGPPRRRYRYVLVRHLTDMPRKVVVFVMVNPSTATAKKDDATIRRCISIAMRLGASDLVVVNLFAARSRHVKHLKRMRDPIGPENDRYIELAIREADVVICAWGTRRKYAKTKFPNRHGFILQMSYRHRKSLHCLGTTRDGSPRHPLFVKHNAPLKAWVA